MTTAVEWLESEMLEHYSPFDNKLLYEAIHKAKEMEIEQAKQICIRTMETDDIPIGGTMNDYFNDVFNYVINKQQEQ
jgi:hypothetical protein